MSNAPQQSLENCQHERRPGTTVCLHCRHDARLAARARRRRLMLRVSAMSIVVAIFGVVGIVSAGALRGRGANPSDSVVRFASAANPPSATDPQFKTSTVTQQGDVAHSPAAPSTALVAAASRAVPVIPVLPIGQSSLADGVTAIRTDGTVLVAFDTPLTRTRMPDKFERFVRATLPRIYGAVADSALVHVARGGIASSSQELLYVLPTRGVHIALRGGRNLALYPEIRPGDDGPLVIRYRVSIASPN